MLRRFVLDDAPFTLRLLNEPGFLRHIGDRGVRTVDDARAYLAAGAIAAVNRMATDMAKEAGWGRCG
ncbi:MAG TPA: hypothetical protein VMN60_09690 [Longimicrobiales bacterium]|nr:hypothetical protein [Longimicrobiales bacterium]